MFLRSVVLPVAAFLTTWGLVGYLGILCSQNLPKIGVAESVAAPIGATMIMVGLFAGCFAATWVAKRA